MTTESVAWLDTSDQSPTSKTNTHDHKSRGDEKRVQRICKVFDRMVDVATGKNGLPRHDRYISEFDLDGPRGILRPNAHRAGNIHVALFRDALWLAGTTGGLPETEHRITLGSSSDQHVYQMNPLHVDSNTDRPDPFVGIDEIADASDDIEAHMNQLLYALEMEKRARWERALSEATLRYALIPNREV